MKWLDAAERVLRDADTPLHYRDAADTIVSKGLVDTKSKTPAIALHASVTLDIQKRTARGLPGRFVILPGGDLSLTEWEEVHGAEALEVADRSREKARRELIRRLRQLDGANFESYLEVLFTAAGYDVTITGGTGDDGVDLIAELDGVGTQRLGVQAKCLGPNREIGPNVIRLLRDALTSYECNAGAVAATCKFNDAARAVAKEVGRLPVQLLGPDELSELALEFRVGIQSQVVEVFEENLDGVFEPHEESS